MSPSKIRAWQFRGVTLEMRDNPTGKTTPLPRHSHSEYQILVPQHVTTQYNYRGGGHLAPPGSLVVLHPDEVHSARGGADTQPHVPLRTLLIPPSLFRQVGEEARRGSAYSPFFPQPVLQGGAFAIFLRLHQTLETSAAALEKDVLLLTALAHLSARHAVERPRWRPAGRERDSVRRVREYLEESYAENVHLARLSDIAGVSPFHLCRIFSQEVGIPPHLYQAQLRIERAKSLLMQGVPIGEVASRVGFADQSHFTRQFKKSTGVTPGRYLHHR